MGKFYLLFIALMIISCKKEEVLVPKVAEEEVADSSGILIEMAKEAEAVLQKQADSIVRQFDSLGVPK
ncbi:MAG: hypothetical protein LBC64_00375 [Fibromonadaceae bacterium]|jgi:hypothetical protein|nr:hypothetical protein [Fibromonadaceae bacterium]